MAKVRFQGQTITAIPLAELPGGQYLMRSRQHAPRLSIGTEFVIASKDVIEMPVDELPANSPLPQDLPPAPADNVGLAALEAAMAEERQTITPAVELIRQHQQNIAEGKTPPGRPIQPRPTPGHKAA